MLFPSSWVGELGCNCRVHKDLTFQKKNYHKGLPSSACALKIHMLRTEILQESSEVCTDTNFPLISFSVKVQSSSSVPMKSRIQPTVPSPPQARTLKFGTSLKKFSLPNTDSKISIVECFCSVLEKKIQIKFAFCSNLKWNIFIYISGLLLSLLLIEFKTFSGTKWLIFYAKLFRSWNINFLICKNRNWLCTEYQYPCLHSFYDVLQRSFKKHVSLRINWSENPR